VGAETGPEGLVARRNGKEPRLLGFSPVVAGWPRSSETSRVDGSTA